MKTAKFGLVELVLMEWVQ